MDSALGMSSQGVPASPIRFPTSPGVTFDPWYILKSLLSYLLKCGYESCDRVSIGALVKKASEIFNPFLVNNLNSKVFFYYEVFLTFSDIETLQSICCAYL
jgi:hypothetical protein